jgi:hypothetical protein
MRIDTAALERYWFIAVETTEPHPLCADYSIEQELNPSGPIEFSPYPQVLDKALRRFASFNWKWHHWGRRWDLEDYGSFAFSPEIPLVIKVSDSPIIPPEEPPHLGRIEVLPPFCCLNETRTLDFSRWMQHIDRLFEVVSLHHEQWPFIEVATGFLLKGFLTRGLESLLWNVASIEALLGERQTRGD